MITKTCTRCREVLPMDTAFFYRCAKTLTGLHPQCKPCVQDGKRRAARRAEALQKPWPPFERWAVFKVLA